MKKLAAQVTVNITFLFANDETFTISADETARDKVMQLKARIDEWGTPISVQTGTSLQICGAKKSSNPN
jgi:hypothetical protein